jgi:nucleoside-diphosphate-sugar epimerase
MRFDLTVNLLTLQAVRDGVMTVFGGGQIRPNIHIRDVARVYLHFLDNPRLPTGFYNAGFENKTVLEIAQVVQSLHPAEIAVSESSDPRSYRLDSSKLLSSGFSPKFSIADGVRDVVILSTEGFPSEQTSWYTVDAMRALGLGGREAQ